MSPEEVHGNLRSVLRVTDVVLAGKGSSSDVTTKLPFNPAAARCFLCWADVRMFGRVVGTWEVSFF